MKSEKIADAPRVRQVLVATRISPSLAKQLDKLVEKSARTRSNYLDMLIRKHVEEQGL